MECPALHSVLHMVYNGCRTSRAPGLEVEDGIAGLASHQLCFQRNRFGEENVVLQVDVLYRLLLEFL